MCPAVYLQRKMFHVIVYVKCANAKLGDGLELLSCNTLSWYIYTVYVKKVTISVYTINNNWRWNAYVYNNSVQKCALDLNISYCINKNECGWGIIKPPVGRPLSGQHNFWAISPAVLEKWQNEVWNTNKGLTKQSLMRICHSLHIRKIVWIDVMMYRCKCQTKQTCNMYA